MSYSLAYLFLIGIFFVANADISPSSCTLPSGALAPNATSCSNTRDTASCNSIFSSPSTTDPKRDPKCVDPNVEDIALECANTCGLCCETAAYTCGDDPVSPINCTANMRYCSDSNWTSVMQKYCPGTCGFCQTAACKDINDGCDDMINLCNDVNFYTYMQSNCQKTCMFCSVSSVTTSPTTSTCSDIATNCAANSGLCNNASYYTLMTEKCASTCGRCSSSSTCTDSNSECATWVSNGFCSNSFYTNAQKQQYCARSCNLC